MLRAPLAAMLTVVVASGAVLAVPIAAQAAPATTVLINELANGGPGSDSDSFFELRNWGAEPVDLSGWNVYRCSGQGLRSNIGRPEAALDGIVLQPGQILTVSKIGMPGDAHMTQPFDQLGFGLYLEAPGRELVDAVGVYPNTPWPTESECSLGSNLPNSLNYATGESWQRVAATGDPARDYIVAPSTVGEQNRTTAERRENTGIVISEVAASGPAANDDEFVELANAGSTAEDIGGWQLYRCTASGRLNAATLQYSVPSGTTLRPGQTWVVAGAGFTGDSDGSYQTPLADVTFGVLLQTEAGRLVDRLSVSDHADSACQDGDDKLPAILDAVAGESYQRTAAGYIVAPRTPGARNATRESSVFDQQFAYPEHQGVAISELATDPSAADLPAGTVQRNFVELGNYGDSAVDIGGWTIRRCEASGVRARELQVTVPDGTTLEPGATWVAARAGTLATADAEYAVALNFLGTGVWLADANGQRVDSVGVYAENEMDSSNVTGSPCTKQVALTTYQPDRLLEETFHRTRFTAVDADDFVTAEATPGVIDDLAWVDPTLPVIVASGVESGQSRAATSAASLSGEPVSVLEAWAGATDVTELTTLAGTDERVLDAAAPLDSADAGWDFPYQRFVLDATSLTSGSAVRWEGSTLGRNELHLSVWDASAGAWRLLQAATGPAVSLSGELAAGDFVDGTVTLLVQDAIRTIRTLAPEPDGQLENPDNYDFAISHITDTQYLSESYPEVYAGVVSWIVGNADDRKIAFATHTGDIVQNWVDPDQSEIRARREFERASAIEGILDDAGVANSVLPGNHDSKRGQDRSLFNEFFPPERYEGTPWYGGSIAPGDNSANYSTFERDGAKFLMLSLPYAYADREIDWAEQVVTSHPDYNVVISTHEHVTPKLLDEPAHRSVNSRWLSRGQDLWDRVIAPNRNVVLVLAGHFHGLGQIATQDAGDIPGHTVVEMLADYQEFRTHTGERATGFQRLLQVDLAGASIAVDTLSTRLQASASFPYDYPQFVPDNGLPQTLSNERPWQIVKAGVQGRYTQADDEFTASVSFQYPKLVSTSALSWTPAVATDTAGRQLRSTDRIS